MKVPAMFGASWTSSGSRSSEGRWPTAAQVAALLLAGLLIAWLHQVLRLPLKLPGRHGLELMAILVLARCGSDLRWAATTTGIGAMLASLALGVGGRDADAGLTAAALFVLQGFIVDAAWPRLPKTVAWGLLVGVLAGLAHAVKPLARWLVESASGLHYGSLVGGLGWPLLTHLMFGFVGGWAAWLAWRYAARRSG